MEPHILLQMPLFQGITEEVLLKFVLLHQHTLKSYKPGEFIAMQGDRKSTRLNSSHANESRMPSSA